MRLILDKSKLDKEYYTIVDLPFEQCEVWVRYNDSTAIYYLTISYNRKSYDACWNSDKQYVLNEYNKLLQAYYNGNKSWYFTWNP